MWPWEHLALGYLLYSGMGHALYRRSPDGTAVLVLAVATQVPDLVDKPLAWSFHVLPHGLSLAHSLLVAVPALVVVVAVSIRRGVERLGTATVVGYLSHLAGDVLYGPLTGGDLDARFLLWPLIERPRERPQGLFARAGDLFGDFLEYLATPAGRIYFVASALVTVAVLALWVYDGVPGAGVLRRAVGVGRKR